MFSLDQYRAVREAAGVVDRSGRGKIALSGADRAEYLQGLLTNDITALGAGTGCYAAYLTPQGRMIADLRVLHLGATLLLDVHPSVKDALLERFEQLIFTEDVQVADWTEAWALYGVHGPRAAATVAAALASSESTRESAPTAEQLAAYAEHQNGRWRFHGATVIVARSNDFGETGFDLYAEAGCAGSLHETLKARGAVDVSPETANVLRVETGRPEFRVDMDEETIPLEAGIEDRAVSFTKGCYVGQEVIIRILHRGHGRVARKLVGLTIDTNRTDRPSAPRAGAAVYGAEKEVGRVTSAVFSQALGKPIALGYVQRDFVAPGSAVQVEDGSGRSSAIVTALPFVKPG